MIVENLTKIMHVLIVFHAIFHSSYIFHEYEYNLKESISWPPNSSAATSILETLKS